MPCNSYWKWPLPLRAAALAVIPASIVALGNVYNTLVPLFLQSGRSDFQTVDPIPGGFGLSASITGIILAVDNLFSIFILPMVGSMSDLTRSRIGSRKPWIILGAPIAPLAYFFIPYTLGQSVGLLMVAAILYVVFVDFIRTPALGLVADIIPRKELSIANGVVALFQGLFSGVTLLAVSPLYARSTKLPFLVCAIWFFFVCCLELFLVPSHKKEEDGQGRNSISMNSISSQDNFIQISGPIPQTSSEPQLEISTSTSTPSPKQPETQASKCSAFCSKFFEVDDVGALKRTVKSLFTKKGLPMLSLLTSTFFCYCFSSGLVVFMSSFASVDLKLPRGQETLITGLFGLAGFMGAVPNGFLSTRYGRKKISLIGICGTACCALAMFFTQTFTTTLPFVLIAGVTWSSIQVNMWPMIVNNLPLEQSGSATGLFFIVQQLSEIIAPVFFGGIIDAYGEGSYRPMYLTAVACLCVSFVLLLPAPVQEFKAAEDGGGATVIVVEPTKNNEGQSK